MGSVNVKTAAEVEAERLESAATSVRSARDTLLRESDWTQMPDSPLIDAERQAWADYRQLLRDIPEQAGFPDEVAWPVEPV